MKFKAVFLDKDGTLIPNIPYNVETGLISLSDGVVEGLQLLQSYGYLLVVVSNQSGIARGYFTDEHLDEVRATLNALCMKLGIYLDGFYYCPHHPEGTVDGYNHLCDCRKPEPGMLLQASEQMNIDLSRSWMIGDILHDVEAGNRAGCKTVLINNGNETEWIPGSHRVPEYFAKDLADAAKYIVTANKVMVDEKNVERQAEYIMHKA